MSHQVVYRKYRSTDFSELIGQEHIALTLSNQMKQDSIGHAYLFFGPRGTGKTSTARIFAKTINCLSPIEKDGILLPCQTCECCINFNTDDIDTIEMDAASNRGIDDARLLKEKAYTQPISHRYKIIILDEAHMLTREAVNALLKIIEEPPEYMIFIFCTTEFHKIPITIASRCQRFKFHFATTADIEKKLRYILQQEQKTLNDQSLKMIAKLARGSFRDAESLLEQVLFSENNLDDLFSLYSEEGLMDDFINNIIERNDEKFWDILCNLQTSQKDIKQFLELILDRGRERYDQKDITFKGYSELIKLVGSYRGGEKEELFYKYTTLFGEINHGPSKFDETSNTIPIANRVETISPVSKTENVVTNNSPVKNPAFFQKSLQKPISQQKVNAAINDVKVEDSDDSGLVITSRIITDDDSGISQESVLSLFKTQPAIFGVIQKSKILIDGDNLVTKVDSTLHKIYLEKSNFKNLILSAYPNIIKTVSIEISSKNPSSSVQDKVKSQASKKTSGIAPKSSKEVVSVTDIEDVFNSKFE